MLETRKGRITIVGACIGSMTNARIKFIQRSFFRPKKIAAGVILVSQVGLSANEQQMIKREIDKQVKFKNFYMKTASFSCACNSGMGTFGLAYYKDKS